ncbi:acyl-CoA thioesterase domain-containing protein [Nocardia tengchongensis]|uniref:acyl-CoA thioesterase domain-containing protein n=1 Tax=Nocardia tengchongensis TaxID=2055889 RepID=UPI0036A8444E
MAFFTRGDQGFQPLPFAASQWAPNSINGSALAGLAAHVLESDQGRPEFRVARFTMDIFRQPKFAPLQADTSLVRAGRSIRISDVLVQQDGRAVARASMVSIKSTQQPAGTRWYPDDQPMPLPEQLATALSEPGIHWGSDAHPDGWSSSMSEHQNASRKRLWFHQPQVMAELENTAFVRAAMLGELTNTLTSWGDRGIGFINHDVTIVLARMPIGPAVGIQADNHISEDGVAAGAATMWDRHGRFGISVVGSIAHMAGSLDVSDAAEEWGDDNVSNKPVFDNAN